MTNARHIQDLQGPGQCWSAGVTVTASLGIAADFCASKTSESGDYTGVYAAEIGLSLGLPIQDTMPFSSTSIQTFTNSKVIFKHPEVDLSDRNWLAASTFFAGSALANAPDKVMDGVDALGEKGCKFLFRNNPCDGGG